MASHQEGSSSISNPTRRRTWKYDIFLSFRGKDTRRGFTSHLHHALIRSGFKVFIDDEQLRIGDSISQELQQAIEESNIAIVILSKNYASSSWCLDELQHILASRNNRGQIVFPIFYDIEPSDVRHQRGRFGEAFAKLLKKKFQKDQSEVQKWRNSLTEVANLSGFVSRQYRHEAELTDAVAEEMRTKLLSRQPPSEELIGIDDKVEQLEPLLKIGLNDVRFVGLWGLGGVGKTTIARAVFEKYRSKFHISCFLENVRATSLERDGELRLQRKLLSNQKIEDTYDGKKKIQAFFMNKKVLLILDDVSQTSHLENFADRSNWFGAGSRVIITTRYLGLLRRMPHEVHAHEVQIMNPRESFQLFCSKAFKRGELQEDLLHMSKIVCDYAKGLPLGLSVLGSSFGEVNSLEEWKDALDKFKKHQPDEILKVLQLSFDELEEPEKAIFLDIACFFNGWSKKVITHILESCGFNVKIGIATLQKKSLLKDCGDCLVMHDLLEQMGKRIVVDNSAKHVGKRSRLWYKEDIDKVMKNKWGTEEIQGMVSFTSCKASWDPNAFSVLRNLRLLIITSDFNLPDGFQLLSPILKVLHWTKYPLNTLPSETQLDELVDLKMRHSKLKKLWNKSLCLVNLKFLDLSYSKNLIETLDFFELPNLERLELEGCEDIVDLHASIGQHTKLRVLNMKGCNKLENWGLKKFEMTALKEFVLCGCILVKSLPEFGEGMKNLEMLDAGETNLLELPESLGLLSGLKTLRLRGCNNLVCLPQSIHKLNCLVLDIAGCSKLASCSKLARLPEKLNEMEALEEIHAHETDITEVPCSIGNVKKAKKLSFWGCKRSTSNSQKRIRLSGHSIHEGLTFPASIWSIELVKELDLSYCNIDDGSIPLDLSGLSSLEKLNLSGNLFKNLPVDCISNLLKLEILYLNSCSELRSLPRLGPSIGTVDAIECGSMETVGDEQLFHLFASIDQVKYVREGEVFEMMIPGSKIPSWFENQIDLCLIDEVEDSIWINMPPCGEEVLGIGLCILLDNDKFDLTRPNERPLLASLRWWFHFAADKDVLEVVERSVDLAIKSSHLWIVLWKQREELSRHLQLSKHSQIPLTLRVTGEKVDAIKCGWRVLSKADFGNCT